MAFSLPGCVTLSRLLLSQPQFPFLQTVLWGVENGGVKTGLPKSFSVCLLNMVTLSTCAAMVTLSS